MGKLKQVLPFKGTTLVGHAVDTAVTAGFDPILVVVGAESDAVQSAVAAKPVEIVRNSAWAAGMGSSIAAAITQLQKIGAESAAVAVLLSDQPLVTSEHLREMRRLLNRSGADAVAADYGGSLGVPAVFKRALFPRLASLSPEAGAKAVLRDPTLNVVAMALPEAAVDIDTPDDFERLRLSGSDSHQR